MTATGESAAGITRVEISDTRGTRSAEGDDFPLSIGGPGTDLQAGPPGAEPLAYLGISEGDVYLQPATESSTLTVNGAPASASKWLRDGDVLRFGATWIAVVVHGEVMGLTARDDRPEDRTDPPLIPPPGSSTGEALRIEPIRFEPRGELAGTRSRSPIGLVGLAVALALLGLIAAAGFLLTSRSVQFAIEPAPDSMAIEGGIAFELGGRHVLRPGSYVLRAQKQGFRDLEAAVEITRTSPQTLRYQFEKLPGRLAISGSPAGAEILIDGEASGLPVAAEGSRRTTVLELAPGEHQVAVRADRYRDYLTTITIEGAGSEQALTFELEPSWADVDFASEPAGARVRLAGVDLGTTPLTAEIIEGSHAFSLLLAGHKIHRGRLVVSAGEAQTLATVRLRPSDGNLVLTSIPAGATVTVGGTYRGETPLDLYLEPGRTHEVSVSKAGHKTEKRRIQVDSGTTRELEVSLTPRQGEVRISTWPSAAELIIDGVALGDANQTLSLTAVAHQIEVRKDGFVAHRRTVTPLPGVPQWVEVTLVPVGEERKRRQAEATPEVVARHDHELRLIQPGKLRMGASRREPGRRANEVLREVEITRSFYLATREVSNRQLRELSAEHSSGMIGGQTLELDQQPAVRVTWDQAAAYCNWLSRQENLPPAYLEAGGKMKAAVPMTTGYRLPTEAEWAWVARYGGGTATDHDASAARRFPWGGSLPVPPASGNYADTSASGFLPAVLSGYSDNFPVTAPVDSFGADARGFYNLGGNVAEWVHDFYAIRLGGGQTERDPLGPAEGEFHVIRGASWMHSTVTELRLSFRDYGNQARPDVGFRVARYAE